MKKLLAALALSLAMTLSACTGSTSPPGTAATPNQDNSGSSSSGTGHATQAPRELEVLKKLDVGLQLPWSVVFLPDGTALVSERDSAKVVGIKDAKATPPPGK